MAATGGEYHHTKRKKDKMEIKIDSDVKLVDIAHAVSKLELEEINKFFIMIAENMRSFDEVGYCADRLNTYWVSNSKKAALEDNKGDTDQTACQKSAIKESDDQADTADIACVADIARAAAELEPKDIADILIMVWRRVSLKDKEEVWRTMRAHWLERAELFSTTMYPRNGGM